MMIKMTWNLGSESLDKFRDYIPIAFDISVCYELRLVLHQHTSSPASWIPAWICNHIHYNVWDEITCPFLNFNGATVEVHR